MPRTEHHFPRIIDLDLQNQAVQEQILHLQRVSYRHEEDLLGFPIPRIEDTPKDLLASGEIFIGMVQDGLLLGLLAFTADAQALDIHRVAVDPDYFRQGVATDLIQFLFDAFGTAMCYYVTTGASNTPAIRLYEKMGFQRAEDFEPIPGLIMTRMIRNAP